MRLLGFINVFNQNPTFLQPVYWDERLNMAFFQHSEDKVTISSFEPADLEYYIKNAKYIVYPEEDILVQTGSTVIFAIYVDGHTFWGDYLDIQNAISVFIDNKKSMTEFPGFYNTCVQFIDEYKGKFLPDVKISKSSENTVIRSLFSLCSYTESDHFDSFDFSFQNNILPTVQSIDFIDCKSLTDTEKIKPLEFNSSKHHFTFYSYPKKNLPIFVDLYFHNKIVPKLWTIDVIIDLIFSLTRIRKTEKYIKSLIYDRWGLDLDKPLSPFREDLSFLPDLELSVIDYFIEEAISFNNIESLYIIDFFKIKTGYILLVENHFTKTKSFVATHLSDERNIEQLINVLIKELLKNNDKKLYLIMNSSRVERAAKQSRFFIKHSDKIQIIELPISNRLEKAHT